MSKFTGDVDIAFGPGRKSGTLRQDLIWECDYLGSGLVVVIPKNFTSDGLTAPRFLWGFVSQWDGIELRAALLHDYALYMLDKSTPVAGLDTREKIDWQFYLALRALEVPDLKARICWIGVRIYSIVYGITPFGGAAPQSSTITEVCGCRDNPCRCK